MQIKLNFYENLISHLYNSPTDLYKLLKKREYSLRKNGGCAISLPPVAYKNIKFLST